jgi:hypothetical protein
LRRDLRIGALVAAMLMALVAVPALAGCGGAAASTSSPAATQSGVATSAPTTYLGQAKQILSQVGTTAATLPDAIAGLSEDPAETSATWTDSGNKLNDIALQLQDDASSLAALTPPNAALQPVQDAVVKGIQTTSDSVKHLANLIYEQSATEAEANGSIPSQVESMKAKLLALSAKLSAALDKLGTPAP